MPRVVHGERPGLVFNLSYGIQGQARYTHVPSILEMMGVPYLGSGPLAHSIALDKVITKMVLVQHGIPTPAFAVLERDDFALPDLPYPVIVKPKHEAVSFGIRVCHDGNELREAAGRIFEMFGQAVLVEQFVEGREVNVGLLGNSPAEALPPCELVFGSTGPTVYSYEDKTGKSGRKVELACPAPIGEELTAEAQEIARRAFAAVGCCASTRPASSTCWRSTACRASGRADRTCAPPRPPASTSLRWSTGWRRWRARAISALRARVSSGAPKIPRRRSSLT